jgi:diguanylate cyclase (GGDEF)-like protein
MVFLTDRGLRILIILVAVFLVLDGFLFGLNQYISREVEVHARQINVAGRQRMLVQAMTKNLLLMLDPYEQEAATENLDRSAREFDLALNALRDGGDVRLGEGVVVHMPKVDEESGSRQLRWGELLWKPLRELLIDKPISQSGGADAARALLISTGPELLNLMNELTGLIEGTTRREIVNLRNLQSAAFAMALFNFGLIVWRFYRTLSRTVRNERFLNLIINSFDVAVLVQGSDKRISNINSRAEEVFGLAREDLKSISVSDLLHSTQDGWVARRPDGTTFKARVHLEKVNLDGTGFELTTVRNLSEIEATVEKLSKIALHDALTGLPNRYLFEDRLRKELDRANRNREMFAVFFLDLDGFKAVNDTHGHRVGDHLLKEVSSKLQGEVRKTDTVARLGGDEFVILYSDITSVEDCQMIAQNVLDAVGRISEVDKNPITLGTSIGISIYPADATSPGDLITRADEAMYQAKHRGKNQFFMASDG